MSDIDINLSGLLALVIFLIGSAGTALTVLICLIVAVIQASRGGRGIIKQRVFAYAISAAFLLVANLVAFGGFYFLLDATSRDTKSVVDTLAMFAWLPLQPIAWIAIGFIINKLKK